MITSLSLKESSLDKGVYSEYSMRTAAVLSEYGSKIRHICRIASASPKTTLIPSVITANLAIFRAFYDKKINIGEKKKIA